jgi:hypothetical protein
VASQSPSRRPEPRDQRRGNVYYIRDKTSDAQRFPLAELLARVLELVGTDDGGTWWVERARGHGEAVCDLEDRLAHEDAIAVAADRLLQIARDPKQWFYDLACAVRGRSVTFGLLDSGCLFIDGDAAAAIASVFEKVDVG